jgi:Tol biopolymer transport system component
VARADGSEKRVVAAPRFGDSFAHPTFSPTSDRIAAERTSGGIDRGVDLFVASVRGGPIMRITSDGRSADPLWGASGIAFTRSDRNGGIPRRDIWLWKPDGGTRRLTRLHMWLVPDAWTADGTKLLATELGVGNRLWAISVPSGEARPITGPVRNLFGQGLSSDGRAMLAAVGCGDSPYSLGHLERIPFFGGERRVIVRGPCRGSWSA